MSVVASGTATITAGQTYVVTSYSLSYVPDASAITVTPQDDLGGRTVTITDITSTSFQINIDSMDIGDHVFDWTITELVTPGAGVDVTVDLDTVRARVGLATADIIDADVTKYIGEASQFLGDQTGVSLDETDCTEAEAEAIRNLAAIKCFFDVTGTSSTGWTASIGQITFSGAPDKIAMINWLWSRVQDFIARRTGSVVGSPSSGTFKVGAANY